MLLPEAICAPRLLKTKQGRLEDNYLRNVNPRLRWSCRGSRAFQERGAVRFRLRIETAVLGPKRIIHALGVQFFDRMLSKMRSGVGSGPSMTKSAASCKASTTWAFSSRPGQKRNGIVEGDAAQIVVQNNSHRFAPQTQVTAAHLHSRRPSLSCLSGRACGQRATAAAKSFFWLRTSELVDDARSWLKGAGTE
jgi:hypothetical protein